MKVAYNACFGGFGLSPLAEVLYAERKGIKLYGYTCLGAHGSPYTKVVDIRSFKGWADFYTEDYGDSIDAATMPTLPNMYYQSSREDDDIRTDPDLIAIIEELGEKEASGSCSRLSIIEIPDGSQFEIEEYDGKESVVPVRPCW